MTQSISATTHPVVYDSAERARGLIDFAATRALPRILGSTSYDTPLLPSPTVFPPPAPGRFGRGAAHYGIMIPDLPAPHYFMANMTVIGYSGFKAWDDDSALQGTARKTATVCHGTAATKHDPFSTHSLDDCEFAPDGSLLRFGDDYTISGLYPNFRLVSSRPGFAVDLELTATGEITWFAKSRPYDHLGLVTRYRGSITHEGTRTEVAGLCTYEYASGFMPYMVASRPLPSWLKFPVDFFSYQVIDLDADTQLLFATVGALGTRPALVGAYLRAAGKGVKRLGTSVRFEVLEHQREPVIGCDAKPMVMPSTFAWTVRDGASTLAELNCTVDTGWLYAGMGNIGGYHFDGRFEGRQITGRGYVEYSDRRH